MTVRLRPHHLFCITTYCGEGYGLDFTENLDTIARRLAQEEDILVVFEPDDICAPLLADSSAHCLNLSIDIRDSFAKEYAEKILSTNIQSGKKFKFTSEILTKLRTNFISKPRSKVCHGCEWYNLCSHIAENKFEQAQIKITEQKHLLRSKFLSNEKIQKISRQSS